MNDVNVQRYFVMQLGDGSRLRANAVLVSAST
jgi:hypothetical protein